MSGFLSRIVARATGREVSLESRPVYRFRNDLSVPRNAQPPPTPPTGMESVFGDASGTAAPGSTQPGRGAAFSPKAHTPLGADGGPGRAGYQPAPPDAEPMDRKAFSHHPWLPDDDAGRPREAPDEARRPREAPVEAGPTREAFDEAGRAREAIDDGAQIMPLDFAGMWDRAGQPWVIATSGGPGDEHGTRIANRRARATAAVPRSERAPRGPTPVPEEPATIVVHIGRIDVRAVHASAAPPPPPKKSRLQRPTLEAYLHSRDRGRP